MLFHKHEHCENMNQTNEIHIITHTHIYIHTYIYIYIGAEYIYIDYMGYPSPRTRSFFFYILYANHVVHFEDVRLVFC
jgi:hypothetical protein